MYIVLDWVAEYAWTHRFHQNCDQFLIANLDNIKIYFPIKGIVYFTTSSVLVMAEQ